MKRQLEMSYQAGYSRIYHKGEILNIDEYMSALTDDIEINDDIYLLIDRMSVDDSADSISRLTDSVETAFYEGRGECKLIIMPAMMEHTFSTRFEADGITFESPSSNLFSFNSP